MPYPVSLNESVVGRPDSASTAIGEQDTAITEVAASRVVGTPMRVDKERFLVVEGIADYGVILTADVNAIVSAVGEVVIGEGVVLGRVVEVGRDADSPAVITRSDIPILREGVVVYPVVVGPGPLDPGGVSPCNQGRRILSPQVLAEGAVLYLVVRGPVADAVERPAVITGYPVNDDITDTLKFDRPSSPGLIQRRSVGVSAGVLDECYSVRQSARLLPGRYKSYMSRPEDRQYPRRGPRRWPWRLSNRPCRKAGSRYWRSPMSPHP